MWATRTTLYNIYYIKNKMKIYLIHSILTTIELGAFVYFISFVQPSWTFKKLLLFVPPWLVFFLNNTMSLPKDFVCSQKGYPSLLTPPLTLTPPSPLHPPSPLQPNPRPKADYFHRNTSLKWSAESMRIIIYITIMLNWNQKLFYHDGSSGGIDPSPPLSWLYWPNPRLWI